MSNVTESQALLTGALVGMVAKYAADPDRGILIDGVQFEQDVSGDYRPCLTVTMRSGAVLRVIVADVTP